RVSDPITDYISSEPARMTGQGKPPVLSLPPRDGHIDIRALIEALYQNAWNRRMLGTLDRIYRSNVEFHGPTDRHFTGLGRYRAFMLSLLAMFPDMAIEVEETYWMGNPEEGYLTSVRWTANATHRGFGVYGEPTNRQVKIWGITQHKIVDGYIGEEWMAFNELDLMMQILGATRCPSD
ncbi:MAG: ester cyclase, partial [Pseudomonadales bacterium]